MRRVLRSYASILAWVQGRPARLGSTRLVCVDGPAGSGKSTVADRLAAAGGGAPRAAVLHLDDLYEGWTGLDGVWERLDEQVLAPLAAGRPGRYQPYDWGAGRFSDTWVVVPVPDVLVVEGCGAAQRAADRWASLRVWVQAPAEIRMRRGVARDGAAMRPQWVRWMALEAEHFSRERTRERAELRVDGAATDAGPEAVSLLSGDLAGERSGDLPSDDPVS